MKDVKFNKLLAVARPDRHPTNSQFTDRVMNIITSSEILASTIRKMDVNKKETFIMRLRYLPRFAVVAIVLGALLTVSTGVAAYQLLWSNPEVTVSDPKTSNSGRQEVSLSLAQCGDSKLADRYELKQNATIKPDQIEGVVKAQCELNVVDEWARKTYEKRYERSKDDPIHITEPFESTSINTSMATRLRAAPGTDVSFVGLTNYGEPERIDFKNYKSIRYIADGIDTTADKILLTDPVAYVSSSTFINYPSEDCKDTSCGASGTLKSEKLLAVIKLSRPFEDYDQYAWQSLTEKTQCYGNKNDTCLSGTIGSVDLYMSFENSGADGDEVKEIQGVIAQIDGRKVTLQSSSGTLFTIITSTDIVTDFNTNRSRDYNNQKVKVGNRLIVRYYENESEQNKTITDNLFSIGLQLEMVGKGDAVNAY